MEEGGIDVRPAGDWWLSPVLRRSSCPGNSVVSPSRGISSIRQLTRWREPPQLEQVFLSDDVRSPRGRHRRHPGGSRRPLAVVTGLGGTAGPNATARGIEPSRPSAAWRRRHWSWSGIAAGSGPSSKQPTVSAQGTQPGGSNTGPTRADHPAPARRARPQPGAGRARHARRWRHSAREAGAPLAELTSVHHADQPDRRRRGPAGDDGRGGADHHATSEPARTGSGGSGGTPPRPPRRRGQRPDPAPRRRRATRSRPSAPP